MTPEERLLWKQLRNRQICGIQFLRQKPIGPYILDFYARVPKICIELDGIQHQQKENMQRDQNRDKVLSGFGITVLRFTNKEVTTNTQDVLNCIKTAIQQSNL